MALYRWFPADECSKRGKRGRGRVDFRGSTIRIKVRETNDCLSALPAHFRPAALSAAVVGSTMLLLGHSISCEVLHHGSHKLEAFR